MSEKTTAELLAELKETRSKLFYGRDTALAWANELNLVSGRARGPTPSEAYWHYRQWCKQQGVTVGYHPMVFRALKRAGFRTHKAHENGKQVFRFMFDQSTAEYFRQWLKENPCPPSEQIRHVRKPKWQKQAEAAGVTL